MNSSEAGSPAQQFDDESIFVCKARQELPTVPRKIPAGFLTISLDHRPEIEKFLRSQSARPSELTFTNLFMWRNHYNYSYGLQGDLFLIRGEHDDSSFLLEPIGNDVSADRVFSLMHISEGLSLERVSEAFVDRVIRGDSRFDVQEAREHWDYIYSRDDLAYLRGRRYHKKRNHVARFEQNYRYDYLELDGELIRDCREVMDEWCRVRKCEQDPDLCAENDAVNQLLDNYTRLDLIGGLVRVEGRPVAVTVGEVLNERTAVIHVEKALKGYNGVYQMINKLFCERGLRGFDLDNREQDLGIEGLRQAKESYYPVEMFKKYSVTLRE